jgi:hypothetical protein
MFRFHRPSCLLVACAGLWSARAQEAPRTWTSTEGTPLQATLVEADATTARLKLANGALSTVPWSRLSQADQEYLAAWLKKQPLKIVMPDVVGVETSEIKIETVREDEENGKFVYRTPNFEFESEGRLAGSLAREVSRSFEATYELLRALPWDIQPKPAEGRYFQASLFKDMEAYYQAGGLPGSAGSYFSGKKRFLVPFQSIGIREVGSAYRMDDDFDTHVLVHELTHQMMHFWLGYLPQWVVEGTAEYTGNLPLKNGKFRVSAAKSGLKDYLEFRKKRVVGGVPEPYPLDKLFSISNEEWNRMMSSDNGQTQRLYFTSYLLVYYFMHLDGKGDGERFVRYMRASAEPRRQVEAYELAVTEFKKRPEVKVHTDGSFEYPRSLQPPSLPRELFFGAARDQILKDNLRVLLDGRTEVQLMEDVRAAYRRLAIKL